MKSGEEHVEEADEENKRGRRVRVRGGIGGEGGG